MGMGGAMDSCGRCMKFSLISINVLTFFGGMLALGLGAWVWSTRSFPSTLMNNNMFLASMIVVVVMGAAIMLLSLLGCCGAAKEVKCMLLTYYILVFIIFVVMLVGGILQFVFREKVVSTLDREMFASLPYYGTKHEYTKAWDDTQTLLKCCGVRSYKDWNDNVPDSCCKEVYFGKRLDCKSSPNPTTMYMDGCLTKTIDFLRENAVYVGVVAIIVALIMSGGAILGGSTAWSILRMSYYFWTSDLGAELGAGAMVIAGALLCLPACWLATLLPYHAKSLAIVGALMCVLSAAMLLLATGLTTTAALSRAVREPTALNHSMMRSLAHETYDPAVRSSWAAMQLELKCCGVHSYSDWYEYQRTLPAACCGRIWNGKRDDQCTVPTHTTGCLRPALAELKGFANSISALSCTMIIVMAVTLFSATYTLVMGTVYRNEGRVYKPPQQLRVACLTAHSPASTPFATLASPTSPAAIGLSNV